MVSLQKRLVVHQLQVPLGGCTLLYLAQAIQDNGPQSESWIGLSGHQKIALALAKEGDLPESDDLRDALRKPTAPTLAMYFWRRDRRVGALSVSVKGHGQGIDRAELLQALLKVRQTLALPYDENKLTELASSLRIS